MVLEWFVEGEVIGGYGQYGDVDELWCCLFGFVYGNYDVFVEQDLDYYFDEYLIEVLQFFVVQFKFCQYVEVFDEYDQKVCVVQDFNEFLFGCFVWF